MLHLFFILSFLVQIPDENPTERLFKIDDKLIKTTITVDEKFLGVYQGRKNGYLKLNADGTGEYLYDIFLPAENCQKDTIKIEWGFILDDNQKIIKFERAYGYSYPIIYRSTGKISFQSCTNNIMLDYILEYNVEEFLTVSSSDDWIKEIPYQEIEKESIEKAVESIFSN